MLTGGGFSAFEGFDKTELGTVTKITPRDNAIMTTPGVPWRNRQGRRLSKAEPDSRGTFQRFPVSRRCFSERPAFPIVEGQLRHQPDPVSSLRGELHSLSYIVYHFYG